jgi:putative membrane protein
MVNALISLVLSAVAIMTASYIIPGVQVDSFFVGIILAIVLTLVNTFIKPFILLLTLPINFLTLGLFSLVINGFMIVIADTLVDGFFVPGFFTAMVFAVVLGLINTVINGLK